MDISGHGRIRVLVTGIYVTGILHLVNQTPAALFYKLEGSLPPSLFLPTQDCNHDLGTATLPDTNTGLQDYYVVPIPSITGSHSFRDGMNPWKVMERKTAKCQWNRSTVADDRGCILAFPRIFRIYRYVTSLRLHNWSPFHQ
jgi:hypothetical protein